MEGGMTELPSPGVHACMRAHEERTPRRRRLLMRSSLVACARSATTARPAIMRRKWCSGTRSRRAPCAAPSMACAHTHQ